MLPVSHARLAPLWLVVGALGCSSTSTARLGDQGGAPAYAIECVQLRDCWSEAARRCRGPFQSVSVTHNEIPESELPGLNFRTDSHAMGRDEPGSQHPSGVGTHGPGIESDEPMPLSRAVVVCGVAGRG